MNKIATCLVAAKLGAALALVLTALSPSQTGWLDAAGASGTFNPYAQLDASQVDDERGTDPCDWVHFEDDSWGWICANTEENAIPPR